MRCVYDGIIVSLTSSMVSRFFPGRFALLDSFRSYCPLFFSSGNVLLEMQAAIVSSACADRVEGKLGMFT